MKITDHIYIVAGGKWGFGMTHELDCNVYLVDGGDGYILIDSGVGLNTERMDGVIESHGFTLSDIKAVVLTQYHEDHACGAARIRGTVGCAVYAPSPGARSILS
ncbi:MAG: MBL fold metallo-hydrolase [Aminivibrio sp.]|jgi:hydroxyacylglutathione hydrolase